MKDQFGMFADQYRNDYTKEQNQQFTAEFSAITQGFIDAIAEWADTNLSDENP